MGDDTFIKETYSSFITNDDKQCELIRIISCSVCGCFVGTHNAVNVFMKVGTDEWLVTCDLSKFF